MAYTRQHNTSQRRSEWISKKSKGLLNIKQDLWRKHTNRLGYPSGQKLPLLGLFNHLPKLQRCQQFVFFEQAAEIGLIRNAQLGGNAADGKIGLV